MPAARSLLLYRYFCECSKSFFIDFASSEAETLTHDRTTKRRSKEKMKQQQQLMETIRQTGSLN